MADANPTPEQSAFAEMAALRETVQTMLKNFSAFTGELAKRNANSATEAVFGLPANPLALPAGSNGTYPVLETPKLHPHLPLDVIAQIRELKFPPTHLGHLLRTFTAAPPQPLSVVMGEGGVLRFLPVTPVPGATVFLREVPDILTFVEAWMTFMSVLQNEHLELPIAQALTAHMNNIITVARVYSWTTVLDYHVAFLQARALDPCFNPTTWSKSDPHLHTMYLLTPAILPPAPLPAVAPPAAVPVAARVPLAAQTCFHYNGAGCFAAACPRRHICRACEGPHPLSACTAAAAPAV
ncbi:hypothetical protein C8R43DRAFT_1195335 [Mycena crocata]|nr:hypothetical protein C8R43DRAFT_1195335 [Mycena crocata]